MLQLPADNQARQGTDLAGQIAGPGATAPTLVLVQFDSGTVETQANQQALAEVQQVAASPAARGRRPGPAALDGQPAARSTRRS